MCMGNNCAECVEKIRQADLQKQISAAVKVSQQEDTAKPIPRVSDQWAALDAQLNNDPYRMYDR